MVACTILTVFALFLFQGHYRYAVAFQYLGQLDSAIRVNEKGLELCRKSSNQDYQNVKELEAQGQNFYQGRFDGYVIRCNFRFNKCVDLYIGHHACYT